jgi:N-acetylgalactosamine kinase
MPGHIIMDSIPRTPPSKQHEERIHAIRQKLGGGAATATATFFIRVPGRVNLIGEHVDYCGYGVLPMAIEQDVLVGCSAVGNQNQATLKLFNVAESEYPAFQCALSIPEIRRHLDSREAGKSPPWHLYFLCGVLGILEHLSTADGDANDLNQDLSMEVVVDGRVPPRAGLSSSSALVCAAALTTLRAYGSDMGQKELAALCAASERFIGTQGGGMDQAIAFLATKGTAQRIEFMPALKGEKVVLPPGAVFVIANSLVQANKAASDGYNIRVAECRLATWVLAKRAGLDFVKFEKVKELHNALGCGFEEILEKVKNNLHEAPYTADEVAELLEMSVDQLASKPLMNRIPLKNLPLKLNQRITHVLNEAKRVHDFHQACLELDDVNTLGRLGTLMNGSHQSLRDLYECSDPKLDQLVGLAQSVAMGARLTGAGWGGCMVVLCQENRLTELMHLMQTKYYKDVDMGPYVFITQPGDGASILDF